MMRSAGILAFRAAASPSSINSSCQAWWASVPNEMRTLSRGARYFEQSEMQVLTIRVTIDLERFVEFGGFGEDTPPIGGQSRSEVIDASARMPVDVHIRIANCAKIALGLVLGRAERGSETSREPS
jgi:hypothetical protein